MANLFRIAITHSAIVKRKAKGIIYYIDTRTNTQGYIQCVNNSGSDMSAQQWKTYFVANATYNQTDFYGQVDNPNATFQFFGNFDYLQFTNYRFFERNVLGLYTEVTTGFVFVIRTVIPPAVIDTDTLPIDVRTPIDDASKVKFTRSPLFLREDMGANDKSIEVKLYVWKGDINTPIPLPTHVLTKDKVSVSDNYITVELSDLVRPYITPKFAYNRLTPPAISGQAVFIQARVTKFNNENEATFYFTNTFLCTLGYRWNYEQNISGNNGVENYGASGFLETVNKWYNPKIHNYFEQGFNFGQSNTTDLINYNAVTPLSKWKRCAQDPVLIVFLNKLGLWEQFTPNGKVTVSTDIDRAISNVSHRDPSQVDNSYIHSKVTTDLQVEQKYVINTGSLTQDMTSIVEELIYSKHVYLIDFKGDVEEVTTVGITIDNTYITIDDTIVTIDSQTVTEEQLGFYKTHQQIPVVVESEDFTRKTRLNDKINIDYNITLAEANNKINNIR